MGIEDDSNARADEIELELRLRESVKIDPLMIEEEFRTIPYLLAYWSERGARARGDALRAKVAAKKLRALLALEAREDLKRGDKRPTEAQIEATVETDERYQATLLAEIDAEVEDVRMKGALTAIMAKKDALVSIGANLRAELERDPVIRERVRGGRFLEERRGTPLPRAPSGAINNCALANGEAEASCQMCDGKCPDRGGRRGL